MKRLVTRLPNFGDLFDGNKMRAMITQLEGLFGQISVDTTRPAYSVTGNTTLGVLDEVVMVDTTSADVEVTLPEISDDMIRAKREFEIVKTAAGNMVTITPGGTDTIVGEPDALVTVQWTALRLRAATGNWVLI